MLVVECDEDREENVCSIIKSSLVTVKLGFSIVEHDEYYRIQNRPGGGNGESVCSMAVKSIVECVEEGTTKFKIDCLIYQLLSVTL